MVRTISISLALFAITSCSSNNKEQEILSAKALSVEQQIKRVPTNKIEVVVYDGCQYIIYKEDQDANTSYAFMTHKGNCSNPIHKGK